MSEVRDKNKFWCHLCSCNVNTMRGFMYHIDDHVKNGDCDGSSSDEERENVNNVEADKADNNTDNVDSASREDESLQCSYVNTNEQFETADNEGSVSSQDEPLQCNDVNTNEQFETIDDNNADNEDSASREDESIQHSFISTNEQFETADNDVICHYERFQYVYVSKSYKSLQCNHVNTNEPFETLADDNADNKGSGSREDEPLQGSSVNTSEQGEAAMMKAIRQDTPKLNFESKESVLQIREITNKCRKATGVLPSADVSEVCRVTNNIFNVMWEPTEFMNKMKNRKKFFNLQKHLDSAVNELVTRVLSSNDEETVVAGCENC